MEKFNRPSAIHKARFLSKLLSSLKIVMLSTKIDTELPKNAVFTARQLTALERFVKFVVYCYVPWWLTSPVPSHAPSNDLALLKALKEYEVIDSVAANTALKAFSNHLWYLTQELVPLSLFCSSVNNEAKEEMREKLLQKNAKPSTTSSTSRFGSGHGKPIMPKVTQEVIEGGLSQFFTENSKHFFEIAKIPYNFLDKPVSDWKIDESYRNAKSVVDKFQVVNDGAERGVKLAQECIDKARGEEKYQNVIQVIEQDRNNRSDQRRLELRKKIKAIP